MTHDPFDSDRPDGVFLKIVKWLKPCCSVNIQKSYTKMTSAVIFGVGPRTSTGVNIWVLLSPRMDHPYPQTIIARPHNNVIQMNHVNWKNLIWRITCTAAKYSRHPNNYWIININRKKQEKTIQYTLWMGRTIICHGASQFISRPEDVQFFTMTTIRFRNFSSTASITWKDRKYLYALSG